MKKKLIVAAVATSSLFAVPSLNDINTHLQSKNLVHKAGSLETLGAVWASRSLIPTIEKGLTPENKEKLDTAFNLSLFTASAISINVLKNTENAPLALKALPYLGILASARHLKVSNIKSLLTLKKAKAADEVSGTHV
jgi:hypothetical protein